MTQFMEFVRRRGYPAQSFRHLYEWSVEKPREFWPQVWRFCDVQSSSPWTQVLEDNGGMLGAKWFGGARLNFAQNLLRYRDNQPALRFWNERGCQASYSYSSLYDDVSRTSQALRDAGVRQGDRVVGFLPNIPQTVIAMLATASLGAVWSSCSPDFGSRGVLDRFGQIEPKILFAADGYFYQGKEIDSIPRISGICREIESIEKVVLVPYRNPETAPDSLPDSLLWDHFLQRFDSKPIDFVQVPFDHPLYIMYSSGTTGLPKCMVHGVGGTLLQHLKELVLHTDLKRKDRIFYYTTCGWMMWNWLISSLGAGSTVVLYDGAPFYPRDQMLWDMAEKEGLTIFGTSAKYLALLEKRGGRPAEIFDLDSLRTILSTGSPLAPESFDYVYRHIKKDVCLSSISGGTDLISCFALGNPIQPVYRGELQTRGLGMAVQIFDEEGNPVRNHPGELVCTRPFPSMPIYFWKDPDMKKYKEAYFNVYAGVWRHGDWAQLTEHDGLIIYGRSDATLNPGGVRIGTAEIYRQVEQLDEVLESVVIGQQWEGDTRIILFVRLRDEIDFTPELEEKIRHRIREYTSPHHVPRKIIPVADIPRTISGKITELAVQRVVHGRPVKNTDALANPEALDLYRDLEELQN